MSKNHEQELFDKAIDLTSLDAMNAIDRYKIVTRAFSGGFITFKEMNEHIRNIAAAMVDSDAKL